MTTNSQPSTTKPIKTKNKNKNELRKEIEQEHIHRNRGCMEVISGEWQGRVGGKCIGNKKHKW